MDDSYRLVILVNFPTVVDVDGQNVAQYEELSLECDVTEPTDINLQSDITSHPLVSGDIIADHMYRQPTTVNVRGTFSTIGSKNYDYSGPYDDRLSNIQYVFETIKEQALFCTLVKRNRTDETASRFTSRRNMVLKGITWVEHQNSLDFTFNFEEAITANVQEVEYNVDVVDDTLPDVYDAATLDFTDTLLDWTEVDRLVIQIMQDEGLVDAEFLADATQQAQAGRITVLASALVGIGAIALVGGPVGWIIAGVSALAAGIGAAIWAIADNINKKNYKIAAFKHYDDDRKAQAEVERFTGFIGSIHENIERLEEHLQVFGLSSNKNQDCMIYIDNNYYIFSFRQNTDTKKWSLNVELADETQKYSVTELTGLNNIGECNENNYIFRTEGSAYWVYVLYLGAYKENADVNDLTNYCVFVSKINMSSWNEMLKDVIYDALIA